LNYIFSLIFCAIWNIFRFLGLGKALWWSLQAGFNVGRFVGINWTPSWSLKSQPKKINLFYTIKNIIKVSVLSFSKYFYCSNCHHKTSFPWFNSFSGHCWIPKQHSFTPTLSNLFFFDLLFHPRDTKMLKRRKMIFLFALLCGTWFVWGSWTTQCMTTICTNSYRQLSNHLFLFENWE